MKTKKTAKAREGAKPKAMKVGDLQILARHKVTGKEGWIDLGEVGIELGMSIIEATDRERRSREKRNGN